MSEKRRKKNSTPNEDEHVSKRYTIHKKTAEQTQTHILNDTMECKNISYLVGIVRLLSRR